MIFVRLIAPPSPTLSNCVRRARVRSRAHHFLVRDTRSVDGWRSSRRITRFYNWPGPSKALLKVALRFQINTLSTIDILIYSLRTSIDIFDAIELVFTGTTQVRVVFITISTYTYSNLIFGFLCPRRFLKCQSATVGHVHNTCFILCVCVVVLSVMWIVMIHAVCRD